MLYATTRWKGKKVVNNCAAAMLYAATIRRKGKIVVSDYAVAMLYAATIWRNGKKGHMKEEEIGEIVPSLFSLFFRAIIIFLALVALVDPSI